MLLTRSNHKKGRGVILSKQAFVQGPMNQSDPFSSFLFPLSQHLKVDTLLESFINLCVE